MRRSRPNLWLLFALVAVALVAALLVFLGSPPPEGRLYLACLDTDQVVVVDAAHHEVVQRLSTDSRPQELALTPDGRRLFVSNQRAATVQMFDVESGRLLVRYHTPPEPSALELEKDGRVLRIAHGDGNTYLQLVPEPEPEAPTAVEVSRPQFEKLARNPSYYTNMEKVEIGGALDPKSRDFYLGLDVNIPEVLVTDAKTHAVRSTIPVGKEPSMVLDDPDNDRRAYVVVRREDALAVLDLDRLRVERKVPVGRGPARMIMIPGTPLLYVMNTDGGSVSVFDRRSQEVVATVDLGGSPLGAVFGPVEEEGRGLRWPLSLGWIP